ncbi:MAG: inositol monophosphatase family protein [Gammaproteobacteria bacterium]|jgi:myo-inositol-1(or 4)-monophosphatase
MTDTLSPDLDSLAEIVKSCALRELLPRFGRIQQQFKSDGSIVTEADLAMQSSLQSGLQARWPQIAFLGEEMPAAQQEQILRDSANGVWVVDPLDGTSNFSQGIACFAVSVALVVNGRIELGLVYDPVRDECFRAQRGRGAWLNHDTLTLRALQEVENMTIGLVDFKRLPAELASKLVSRPPYKSQRSFGSVALDWCWIAAGRGDVYVHGKQKLWDYAAGQLILAEAGGFAATLQGEPVFNGTLQPRSAALAINQRLFDTWLAYLQ